MGKNKNRNKRNKKNNVSFEPKKESSGEQKNFSSPKTYNHSIGKKEVLVNINCTINFPEMDKTQNKLKSLSISESQEGFSKSRTSTELRKVVKEEEITGIVNEKSGPELSRKASPSFETNYNDMEIFLDSNNTNGIHLGNYRGKNKKAGPKIESKSKPLIEKHSHVKETRSIVKNYNDETRNSDDYPTGYIDNKIDPFFHNNEVMKYHSGRNSIASSSAKSRIESKSKPFIEKQSYVKETQAFVKNQYDPTAIYQDKTRYRGGFSERTSTTASVPKMQGARPKTETKFKNSTLNDNFKNRKQNERDSQLFRQQIQGGVRKYESHWENFDRQYRSWISQRKNTIQKLQELVEKVHKEQKMFNEGIVTLKEINVGSRELKIKNINQSPTVDFLASFATFVTDAASGITSIVQACNIDSYTVIFKEIMENDAEVTRPLYAARSQCLKEYQNVEEILRQCHLETFGSTIDNISSTLNVDDLLMDLKNIKGENTFGQVFDSVGVFLKRNANREVMGEVCNSIQDYMDSNPATLEACKSAGKALYGVFDTWGRDHKQGRASIAGNMSIISNQVMLIEDRKELSRLRSVADNDEESQAKLESEIHGAISSLQNELTEINNIFERRNHSSSPWYF